MLEPIIADPPEIRALRSRRVVTPTGTRPAAILVRGGRITAVVGFEDVPASILVEDFGDLAIMPGLVDIHVHINDPGRSDWEGFATATTAAAVGGITTLVDMPLNSTPVTTTPAALAAKHRASIGKLRVDCGFFGGIVPGNADEVEPLVDAGVLGFKAFLCHSGIDEFPNATEADLRLVMPILSRHNLPLMAHAELVPDAAPAMAPDASRSYAAWLASRPEAYEIAAIELLIRLCRETGCRVHIVHLAAAAALPLLAEAQAEGLPITGEACPHYLTFAAEEIPDGDPRFKCAPPIRSAANREALWAGLGSGIIRTIGTDHSPAPPGLKQLDTGDLARAWGGISSLQISLPAVWTEACRRGFTLNDLAWWMAAHPARLVGLIGRKGEIRPGADADLVVFDPETRFEVDSRTLHHRHPATPYDGRSLFGKVVATYLRGVRIARDGQPNGGFSGRTIGDPLDRLNAASRADAVAALLRCCGTRRWAERLAERRPFSSSAALRSAAEETWQNLEVSDHLEAFASHPRIGDRDALRQNFATTAEWAASEQGGVAAADGATRDALAEGNRDYETRFGHIFLVCATGKSAREMLTILRGRLDNPPEVERAVAAGEQLKISLIRLEKLVR